MKIVLILDNHEGLSTHSAVPNFVADMVKRLVADSGIKEITIKREAEG